MKKLILLYVLFTAAAQAQTVNFTDTTFKAQLLQAAVTNDIAKDANDNNIKIDSNNNGEIENSEALAVYSLSVGGNNIADFTGIKSFSNLKKLTILTCPATVLDIADMGSLKNLKITMPQLQTLVFSGVNLEGLGIYNAMITTLDLRHMSNLVSVTTMETLQLIDCNFAGLSNLSSVTIDGPVKYFDATGTIMSRSPSYVYPTVVSLKFNASNNLDPRIDMLAPNLNYLEIHNTPQNITWITINNTALTSINLINCQTLIELAIFDSPLNTIDVTQLPRLETLALHNTNVSYLDTSMLPNMKYLWLGDSPINFLNMKNGTTNLREVSFDNMDAINYICVNEHDLEYVRSQADLYAIDPMIGSDCSFTPGGNYNTITGKVTFDANANGCDAADGSFPLIKMKLLTDSDERYTFTKPSGNYTFYTGTGTHTIAPVFENPSYFNSNPQNSTINFPTADNLVHQQDFCITANGNHPDAEVVITPLQAANPGFEIPYKIAFKNKGNQILNGNVTFTFDDARIDFISASQAATQSTGNLVFNYSNLMPFESRGITIRLRIHAPTEIPGVHIDDILPFSATIHPVAADETPDDNVFAFGHLVTGSYDPNNKIGLEGESVTPENIGKYLHYNINFENTGNADAINIVIRDTINPEQFDIKSLEMLNSSHPVKIDIKGNVVAFIFENINLPPSITHHIGGHGNVLFKIRTKDYLTAGDVVENTASIYFDYNAPIVTNEAKTTFQTLSTAGFKSDDTISVYPNPVKDLLKIQSKNTIKSIELFDVQGRILQTSPESKKETTLDLSKQSKGIYFLKITTEKGSKIEKIIKG